MSLGKSIGIGMVGALLQMGVDVDRVDWERQTLYITVPKDCDEYHGFGAIKSPETLASNIKRMMRELGVMKKCVCKYRVKDVYWTHEMGRINLENNSERLESLFT